MSARTPVHGRASAGSPFFFAQASNECGKGVAWDFSGHAAAGSCFSDWPVPYIVLDNGNNASPSFIDPA